LDDLERITEPLSAAFRDVQHLSLVRTDFFFFFVSTVMAYGVCVWLQVKSTPATRAANSVMQPLAVEADMRVKQSSALYTALKQSAAAAHTNRAVALFLRDAELEGAALPTAAQRELAAVQLELSALGTRFGEHVLDATKAYGRTVTARAQLAGLPLSALAALAQDARQHTQLNAPAASEDLQWRLSLAPHCLQAVLMHATDRGLREELFRQKNAVASAGATDNTTVMAEILRLRRRKANLLGFATYAELSLASKMAGTVGDVTAFTAALRGPALMAAAKERADLLAFAVARGHPAEEPLAPWDVPFWETRMKEAALAYSEETLKKVGHCCPLKSQRNAANTHTHTHVVAFRVHDCAGWHVPARFASVWY
jgi:oligopeptidase A